MFSIVLFNTDFNKTIAIYILNMTDVLLVNIRNNKGTTDWNISNAKWWAGRFLYLLDKFQWGCKTELTIKCTLYHKVRWKNGKTDGLLRSWWHPSTISNKQPFSMWHHSTVYDKRQHRTSQSANRSRRYMTLEKHICKTQQRENV